MSKITDAVKQLQDNENANKILDSLLAKGLLTIGNENDYINCINTCYPNATPEDVENVVSQLESKVDEGTQCNYYLLDFEDSDALLSIQVAQNLYLNFYLK